MFTLCGKIMDDNKDEDGRRSSQTAEEQLLEEWDFPLLDI